MICQALWLFLRTSLKICDLNEIDLFDTGRREQRGRSNILEEASVWSPPPELRPHRFNSGILPSLRFDQAAKQIYHHSWRCCLFDPQRPRRTYCLQRRPIAIQARIIAPTIHPIQYYKCLSKENFSLIVWIFCQKFWIRSTISFWTLLSPTFFRMDPLSSINPSKHVSLSRYWIRLSVLSSKLSNYWIMSRPGIGFGRVMSCCLGQVLVFAFVLVLVFVIVLVKFSAFSTLHKPHHLSLQLSVHSRGPSSKFYLFLAPLINAKKWQKSKALPQREVHCT